VHLHWRFKKGNYYWRPRTAEFTSDAPIIDNALAEPLGEDDDEEANAVDEASNNETDYDDLVSLPDITDLLHGFDLINKDLDAAPKSTSEQEVLSDGDDLLDVNEPRKVKPKGRPKGAKGKKRPSTRAENAEAKSSQRDSSGFEHVEARLQAARGDKKRGKGGEARGGRDRATHVDRTGGAGGEGDDGGPFIEAAKSRRTIKKKPFVVVVLAKMDAEIAAIEAKQQAEYADYLELHDRARQRGQKAREGAVD